MPSHQHCEVRARELFVLNDHAHNVTGTKVVGVHRAMYNAGATTVS